MITQLELVGEFHQTFEIHEPKEPCLPGLNWYTAAVLSQASAMLKELSQFLHQECARCHGAPVLMRAHLMTEELGEVLDAVASGSLRKTAHELNDLDVVTTGSVRAFGLAAVQPDVQMAIHNANMSKLGADGKPLKNAAGRILKGPNFKPADLSPLFPNEVNK